MTRIILTLLIVLFACPNLLANRRPIISKNLKDPVNFNTEKVAYIRGTINETSYRNFKELMEKNADLKGDRIIYINSPGGSIEYGGKMQNIIDKERLNGTRIVCYVEKYAHSMAFNLLTNCDIRIANSKALSLVHKTAFNTMPTNKRLTAKTLRECAVLIDKCDNIFRVNNAKAMRLTLEEYDNYADSETYWTALTLFKIGYYHAIVELK